MRPTGCARRARAITATPASGAITRCWPKPGLIVAGTEEVLLARLRQGRANTARDAAHFLGETVSRVRHAGATGPLTLRADSGFYTHAIVAVCRDKDVRFSITIRQHQSVRNIIEAIPDADWTPIPLYLDFGDGAERGRLAFPGSRQTVQ